jgi:hypothetical protein
LKTTGLTYIEFELSHPNHYRLMFMSPHPQPSATVQASKVNPEEDAYAFLKIIVGECLQQRLFREEFQHADAVAQVLWAGVHGIVSLQVA